MPVLAPGAFRTATFLAACLVASAAWAQASPQRIEIIGQSPLPGSGRPLGEIAAPVQSANADELRNSQALDVSEHINRRFGSVFVNEMQGNPLQADVNFRGFTASPLLGTPQGLSVYLDGVRLNQPFGDVVSWDLIPRNALARLTLLPGSNPLFGLNTLGGALVLESKDGHSHPGGDIELQLGSATRRVAAGTYGRDLGNGLDLFVAGQFFKESGWRDFSPSEQKQLFVKVGWRGDSRSLKLSLAHADTALNGNGLQDVRDLAQRWASVFSQPDITRNRSTLVSLLGTQDLSPGLSLTGNAYARRLQSSSFNGDINDGALDQNLYFNPTPANVATLTQAGYSGFPAVRETPASTAFPQWACVLNAVLNEEPNEKCTGLLNRSATRQSAWGLAVQATVRSRWGDIGNELTVGLGHDAARVRFRQSAEFGYITADRGVAGTGVFADGTQDSEDAFDSRVDLYSRTRTTSVYASDVVALSPAAQLTLAGRWNRTAVTMSDQLDPAGGAGTLNGSHRFSRLNPSIGGLAKLAPALVLYGSVGEGSRAPTATELGCADPADPCRLPNAMASDPPLRQVVTRTLEAGLRGRFSDTRWNLGVFRADNWDDLLFVASPTAGTGYFRNFGKTRRQGFEAGASTRAGALELGLHYTRLDATFRSAETVSGASNSSNDLAQAGQPGLGEGGVIQILPGNRMPLVPRDMLKAFAQWQAAPTLAIGAEVLGVSGAYARGNENNAHQADGIYLGAGRSSGYGVLNANASWQPAKAWTLSLKLNNVFDRRYGSAAVLGATPFNAAGSLDARQAGSYLNPDGSTSYVVRQTTFQAPGAPRQAFIGLRRDFD